MNSNKKIKAFTLIELAIVLVIIALVVGGVVYGRKIIYNYQLSKIVRDVNEFRSAISMFKDKYNNLPGDVPEPYVFWPTLQASDNGNCRNQGGNSLRGNGTLDHAIERTCFGVELSYAEMIKQGLRYGSLIPGVSVAKGPVENTGYLPAGNQLNLGRYGQDAYYRTKFLTANEAKNIDEKLDDGLPYNGQISGINSYAETGCTTSTNPSNARYSTTTTDVICYLELYILY